MGKKFQVCFWSVPEGSWYGLDPWRDCGWREGPLFPCCTQVQCLPRQQESFITRQTGKWIKSPNGRDVLACFPCCFAGFLQTCIPCFLILSKTYGLFFTSPSQCCVTSIWRNLSFCFNLYLYKQIRSNISEVTGCKSLKERYIIWGLSSISQVYWHFCHHNGLFALVLTYRFHQEMERGKEGEKYLECYDQGKTQCFSSMNPAVRKRRRKHTN